MLSIVDETKLRRILARMLDEAEFFGPHGIRALSRYHLEHPYVFHHAGQEHRVDYVPGDSDSGMFGGNSNWRGPVWMPINFLLYTLAAAAVRLLRRGVQSRVPDRLGQHDDAARGGARNWASA